MELKKKDTNPTRPTKKPTAVKPSELTPGK